MGGYLPDLGPSGDSKHKVRVVHHGVDATFRKLPDPWLVVGTKEPRENLAASHPIAECAGRKKRNWGLITGRVGWKSEALLSDLRENGEQIVVTGFVPFCDLVMLYSSAEDFVLPSRYEGFGFPLRPAVVLFSFLTAARCLEYSGTSR